MENKQQTFFILVIIIFLSTTLYFFWPTLKKEFERNEVILVTIKLDNRCSLLEDAFIVKHKNSNKTATFNNGRATINVGCSTDALYNNVYNYYCLHPPVRIA